MRGTDVHPFYQRGLNWKAAPDIHFAWVKVSDGGAPYSTVQQGVKYVPDTHVAGAKAAGIPVGGYHYAQLTPGPDAQADVLLAQVRRLGATGVAPMLDLEVPFRPDTTAKNFGIAFCKKVAAAGFRPTVYMSASFAAALRPDTWDVPGLVIVIARYGARPEAPGSGQYRGRYDVHQYSSSGTLPGSAGLVDLDESYTNAHLPGAAPNPEEDMALTQADAATIFWGTPFDGPDNFAQYLKGHVAKLEAGQAGILAAVQAATKDPTITLDAMRQVVNDAVAQHVVITGEVHIGSAVTQ